MTADRAAAVVAAIDEVCESMPGPDAMVAGPSLQPIEAGCLWADVLEAVLLDRQPRIYPTAEAHAPTFMSAPGEPIDCLGCDEPWPCGAFRRAAEKAGAPIDRRER